MDICDKCEKEISTLEPCFKVSYGFSNEDESFFEDIYLILHLECLNDEEVLSTILSSLKKNQSSLSERVERPFKVAIPATAGPTTSNPNFILALLKALICSGVAVPLVTEV